MPGNENMRTATKYLIYFRVGSLKDEWVISISDGFLGYTFEPMFIENS